MFAAALRCAPLAILIAVPAAVQAAGKATVRGAEAVKVREQPSTDSPTIVSLRKGKVVTVEKVQGPWALITLESGRRGYVKAVYLELPAAVAAVAVTTAPPVVPSPTSSPPPTETPESAEAATPEVPAAGGQRGALEHEVARLRDRLTALESAVATPASAATPAKALPFEREPARGAGSVAAPLEPDDVGPSLTMAGVGLVVGFLLGAAYGRRQERNRRSRVRF